MAQDKAADIIRFNAGTVSGGESAGAFLAAARAAAGLSLAEVSEATKLKPAHIEAIEAMRPDLLPAMPYAVGFVKAYARFLRLDAEALAVRFRHEVEAAAPVSLEAAREGRASAEPAGDERAKIGWVFAIMAVALFFVWVLFQVLSGGERQDPLAGPERRVTVSATPALAPVLRPAPESAPAAQEESAPPVQNQASEEAAPETAAADAAPEASGDAAPQGGEGEALSDIETAAEVASEGPAAATPPQTATPQAPAAQIENRAAEPQTGEAQTPTAAEPIVEAPRARPLPRRAEPAPVVVEAALTRSAAPQYPDRCTRSASDLEAVTVRFDVDAAGRAANMRVVSTTNACFNDEALRAIERWRFSPRTVDGAAARESGKTATLNFRK